MAKFQAIFSYETFRVREKRGGGREEGEGRRERATELLLGLFQTRPHYLVNRHYQTTKTTIDVTHFYSAQTQHDCNNGIPPDLWTISITVYTHSFNLGNSHG